jgi:hypothetical protein
MRNAYKSCFGELGGKRPFGIPWHGGNKMGCKEMGLDIVGWLCLDQDRV